MSIQLTFLQKLVLTFSQKVGSQVKSIHKQQTTIRQPIEIRMCSGGQQWWKGEWAEMTEGVHREATRREVGTVLTYVPSEKK